MQRKLNCWEVKKCGHRPEIIKAVKGGVCPSVHETRLDGVHGGRRAGRACWVVAGTQCGGATQGHFAKKYKTCVNCDFYQQVLAEEGANFTITLNLMKLLRGD